MRSPHVSEAPNVSAEWRQTLYTGSALLLAAVLFVYSPLKQWQYSGAMTWITTASLLVTLYPVAYFMLFGSSAFGADSDTAMLPLVDFLNHNADQEVRHLVSAHRAEPEILET